MTLHRWILPIALFCTSLSIEAQSPLPSLGYRALTTGVINGGGAPNLAGRLIVTDYDGDGADDIIRASMVAPNVNGPNPGLYFFRGNGAGKFDGDPGASAFVTTQTFDAVAGQFDETNSTHEIAVLEGSGAISILAFTNSIPSFTNLQSQLTSANGLQVPMRVLYGDVTGDNVGDLVVPDFQVGGILVFSGIGLPGAGFVTTPTTFTVPSILFQPSDAELIDVTGDGRLDVVAVDAMNSLIVVFPGLSGGGFGTPTTVSTGIFLSGIGATLGPVLGVGDLDADGDVDVAVVGTNGVLNRIVVARNNGTGTLTVTQTINGLTSNSREFGPIGITDVTGDGVGDIIVSNTLTGAGPNDLTIRVFRGSTSGTVNTSATPLRTPTYCNAVTVGHCNADDIKDLVIGSYYTPFDVFVLESNPITRKIELPTAVRMQNPISSAIALARPAIGRLNNDATNDMVVVSTLSTTGVSRIEAFLGTGGGSFGSAILTTLPTNMVAGSPLVADFNGDGIDDFAAKANTSGASAVIVMMNNGAGTFAAPITVVSGSTSGMDAADFNGDGRDDLVISSAAGVQLFLATGTGFAAPTTIGSGGTIGVHIGQCDAVSDLDVALVNSSNVVLLTNPFPGTSAGSNTFAVSAAANVASVDGDFDGDGFMDLAVATALSGSPSLPSIGTMFSTQTGFFAITTIAVSETIGFALSDGIGGDVNNDGLDEALFHTTNDSIVAWNPIALAVEGVYSMGLAGASFGLGDADSDGADDLLQAGMRFTVPTAAFVRGRGRVDGWGQIAGVGAAGTGGFTPRLSVDGRPEQSQTITLRLEKGLGGASATFVAGSMLITPPTSWNSGVYFHLGGSLLTAALTLSAGGPGQGSIAIPFALPPGFTNYDAAFQVFVTDAGNPALGASASNAVFVHVQ